MSPTIRIDDEVYEWLKSQAEPFEDTPNSVLRRILKMDKSLRSESKNATSRARIRSASGRRLPLATGDDLLQKWSIPAVQARFHRDGTFYALLERFPAALCDRQGYILFASEDAISKEPKVRVGPDRLNVPSGISTLAGYILVDDPI